MLELKLFSISSFVKSVRVHYCCCFDSKSSVKAAKLTVLGCKSNLVGVSTNVELIAVVMLSLLQRNPYIHRCSMKPIYLRSLYRYGNSINIVRLLNLLLDYVDQLIKQGLHSGYIVKRGLLQISKS